MRERLHAYTKRTLGAGGSYNDAVRLTALKSALFEFQKSKRGEIMVCFRIHHLICTHSKDLFVSLSGGIAAGRVVCSMGGG
jgi:hypothetical protein